MDWIASITKGEKRTNIVINLSEISVIVDVVKEPKVDRMLVRSVNVRDFEAS